MVFGVAEKLTNETHFFQVFLSSSVDAEPRPQLCPHRTFLLIVGLEQTLLCVLMQQVSTQLPSAEHQLPSVDAVYVDRARALLLELRAQDLLNLDQDCSTPLPSLVSADAMLSSVFRRSSKGLVHSVSQHGIAATSSKPRKLSDSVNPWLLNTRPTKLSDSEEDESPGEGAFSRSNRRSHSMLHLKTSFRKRKAEQSKSVSSVEQTTSKTTKPPRPPFT